MLSTLLLNPTFHHPPRQAQAGATILGKVHLLPSCMACDRPFIVSGWIGATSNSSTSGGSIRVSPGSHRSTVGIPATAPNRHQTDTPRASFRGSRAQVFVVHPDLSTSVSCLLFSVKPGQSRTRGPQIGCSGPSRGTVERKIFGTVWRVPSWWRREPEPEPVVRVHQDAEREREIESEREGETERITKARRACRRVV